MPHLTWRHGPEVRVVVSRQRQGQVYLCDAADLGPSARRRRPVSESRSGDSLDELEIWAHATFRTGHLSVPHKEQEHKNVTRLFRLHVSRQASRFSPDSSVFFMLKIFHRSL